MLGQCCREVMTVATVLQRGSRASSSLQQQDATDDSVSSGAFKPLIW